METNYRDELLNLLKNNRIYTLPSYQAISNDEQLAIISWESFSYDYEPEYQNFSFKKWYAQGDWNNALQAYADNTVFWEKILQSKFHSGRYSYNNEDNSYTILLDEGFQKSYPIIANHFLKNNDKLVELFNKTKNKTFFDLTTLSQDEKEVVMKNFIIQLAEKREFSYSSYSQYLIKFENDKQFVSKLLEIDYNLYAKLSPQLQDNEEYINIILKNPASFKLLSNELKKNPDYINIGLQHKENFYELSALNQNKYFDTWIEDGISTITYKMVNQFNNTQKQKIFSLNVSLLKQFLEHKPEQISVMAEKLLNQDFDKFINVIPAKVLQGFSVIDSTSIKPVLEDFINTYNKQGFDKSDEKYLLLISKDPQLFEKLNENVFYKLNTSISEVSKHTVEKSWFIQKSQTILQELDKGNLTPEIAKSYVIKAREKLTIDELKNLSLSNEDIVENVRLLVQGNEVVKKTKLKH